MACAEKHPDGLVGEAGWWRGRWPFKYQGPKLKSNHQLFELCTDTHWQLMQMNQQGHATLLQGRQAHLRKELSIVAFITQYSLNSRGMCAWLSNGWAYRMSALGAYVVEKLGI